MTVTGIALFHSNFWVVLLFRFYSAVILCEWRHYFFLSFGVKGWRSNGPEIAEGRPDHNEVVSKGVDEAETNTAAFRQFHVGRRPAE